MFKTLWQSLKTGVVTTAYPRSSAAVSNRARGKPEIDWANWTDPRPAAAVCPTGAIECGDGPGAAALDLGKCVFCGLCAEADTVPSTGLAAPPGVLVSIATFSSTRFALRSMP